eukprot:2399640-Prymnesium_polylepis.1
MRVRARIHATAPEAAVASVELLGHDDLSADRPHRAVVGEFGVVGLDAWREGKVRCARITFAI